MWLGAVHVIETRLWGVAEAASRRPTGMQKTNVVMIQRNTYFIYVYVRGRLTVRVGKQAFKTLPFLHSMNLSVREYLGVWTPDVVLSALI